MSQCFVCLTEVAEYIPAGSMDGYKVNCPKCGRYDISGSSAENYKTDFSDIQRANLSGWLHKNISPPTLTSEHLEPLKRLVTPTVHAKAQMMFTYFCRKYPTAGQILSELHIVAHGIGSSKEKREESARASGAIEGACSLTNREELKYILNNYLVEEEKLIKTYENQFSITP